MRRRFTKLLILAFLWQGLAAVWAASAHAITDVDHSSAHAAAHELHHHHHDGSPHHDHSDASYQHMLEHAVAGAALTAALCACFDLIPVLAAATVFDFSAAVPDKPFLEAPHPPPRLPG